MKLLINRKEQIILSNFAYHGKTLDISDAPDPININWQNFGKKSLTNISYKLRQSLKIFVWEFVLAAVAFLLEFLKTSLLKSISSLTQNEMNSVGTYLGLIKAVSIVYALGLLFFNRFLMQSLVLSASR